MSSTLLVQMRDGKCGGPSLATANGGSNAISERLFVTDAYTKDSFLVDSGADISVYPRSRIKVSLQRTSYELSATNGTAIFTYKPATLTLNFADFYNR